MRSVSQPVRRHRGWTLLTVLFATLLVVGCDTGPAPSSPPTAAAAFQTPPASTVPAPPTVPGTASTTTPAPTSSPVATSDGALVPGAIAVTVSDRLRVRSEPRVAADSLKLQPVLPIGTQLVVTAGPVQASDYTWFRVAPLEVTLAGGVDQGWVAVADHDGTPWVALAGDATPGFELAAADLTRGTPSVAAAKAQAAANNKFGIALYKRMLKDPDLGLAGTGVVVSPASVVTALAMARAGAKGATAAEMDKVLRVDGWNRLGDGLSSLNQLLGSRDATWKDYADADQPHQLALRIANMAFGQRDYSIEAAYLDRIGRTFGSGLGLVDYINDADGARNAINAWASRQTLGRIPSLLAPPNVSEQTRLILVNAIYLKAEWAMPFDVDQTQSRTFTTLAGSRAQVPTMYQAGGQDLPLATGDGWRATELRYLAPNGSSELAMTMILPDDIRTFEELLDAATLAQVQQRLNAERRRLTKLEYTAADWADMRCGTYPYSVNLYLPKFGIDTRANLIPSLRALGMEVPFDGVAADFSGITATDPLHIGMVIHQANIDVDESGTEAAAATAIGMDTTGGCGGPSARTTKTLRLHKPFLFLLRDVQTGAILFMGRVVDPTQR